MSNELNKTPEQQVPAAVRFRDGLSGVAERLEIRIGKIVYAGGHEEPGKLVVAELHKELMAAYDAGLSVATSKVSKAIALLESLERECLVPDFAHDAVGSCPLCRLVEELRSPLNGQALRPAEL